MVKIANASLSAFRRLSRKLRPESRCCDGATGCGPAASPKESGIRAFKDRDGTTGKGSDGSLTRVLPGMVGAADQGARLDVAKAHRHRRGLKLGEFGRGHVALDRQMVA